MMRYGVLMAAMLAGAGAAAQDAFKSADLTGAGAATCVEATLPRGCMFIPTTGIATVVVRVTGTWSATVVAEGSPEGDASGTWTALDLVKLATGAWTLVANTTANATFVVSSTGMRTVRIRASAYASGTIVLDAWSHSRPWAPVYSRDSSGNMVVSIGAGTANLGDVDVEIMGTACTVDTEQTGLVADTTIEAATASMRLKCFDVRETSGAAAFGILRHGVVAGTCTGNALAYVDLAPYQNSGACFEAQGKAAASGVCLDWVSGGTYSVTICTTIEAAP